MLLVVDCGNTNIVFGLYQESSLVANWRTSTLENRTPDDYASWLLSKMSVQNFSSDQIDAAIISSVVPERNVSLRKVCEDILLVDVTFIEDLSLPISITVDNPEEVGSDRLVTAIAAKETYGGPLIVIDFGTATTFDVLDHSGAYLGGLIAPGINLSMDALHMSTALLPEVSVGKPEGGSVIGTSTVSAMKSGIFWGYIGLIEGVVQRIQTERGGGLKVIATGGLAPLFSGSTLAIDHTDPDLIFRGLRTIYIWTTR